MFNFLPTQYKNTLQKKINHNYLHEQFSDYEDIFKKIASTVLKGDYTLGDPVNIFEKNFSKLINSKYSIGVGSGTDALFLSLKALNIGDNKNDEVITTPFTFYATIGAIVTAGAKPVFVDVGEDYNIDTKKIEKSITKNTKAILPVHWTGRICDMKNIKLLCKKYNLKLIEDSCHALLAKQNNKFAGTFGDTGCFSLHPLKNLNVWGDGGIVCTQSKTLAKKIYLLRNHGLSRRDKCKVFAFNSRLDTIQAIVGNHLLKKIKFITRKRIENSVALDKLLKSCQQAELPKRKINKMNREVFHLYSINFKNRNKLKKFLESKGIDARIHYPIPMHLQPAAKYLNYQAGDFPVAEMISKSTLSLPVHEFISKNDLECMVNHIYDFYK